MDREALSALPSAVPAAVLTDMVEQVYALICALTALLVRLLDVCRERGVHLEDHVPSIEDWTRMRLGLRKTTAREYVRMGRALADLPKTTEALSSAELSIDQASAISRYATPDNEAEIVGEAQGTPVSVLDRRARRATEVSSADADASHQARRLRIRWNHDRSELSGWFRLPAAEGATVQKALERNADSIPVDPVTGVFAPYEARLADALVGMAHTSLSAGPHHSSERASVVVHVDAQALTTGTGHAEIQAGPPIAIQTAERMLCDADVRTILSSDGRAVGIGRRSRTIPSALEQVLWERDGGCIFCGATRWLQGHHIVRWSQGGRTDADNVVLVCLPDHQLLHEGGWRLEGNPYTGLILRAPDGRVWKTGPKGLRDDIKTRFFGKDPPGRLPPDTS